MFKSSGQIAVCLIHTSGHYLCTVCRQVYYTSQYGTVLKHHIKNVWRAISDSK